MTTDPIIRSSPRALQLAGVGLFLFIPVVLVLFVRQPEPLAASLGLGIVLMLGHRRVARPYMERARPHLCVWCHRPLPADARPAPAGRGDGRVDFLACPSHALPTRRFLAHLGGHRLAFRLAIGLPLVTLLAAVATAAVRGPGPWLLDVTRSFQLAIGLAVNLAALPQLWPREPAADPSAAAFPLHNLHLLGIGWLLWVLRLVGLAWIAIGLRHWLAS